MSNNKSIEEIYEKTKYQIVGCINQIIANNKLPAFLVAVLLKEISNETSIESLSSIIARNEILSKEEYAEFLEFMNNQNNKEINDD